MLSLILATIVGQVAPDATVKWRDLSNLPGWQGYGPVLPSGWIDPVKFRRTDDTTVEYPAAGREKEFVLSDGAKAAQSTGAVASATVTQPATYDPPPVPGVVPQFDPYGFTNWLNNVRASYGLQAVGHDPNLSNWAAQNNAQQQARGLGHYIMGPARRQNSAMGGSWPGDMWMASGGHRAALLDPTIRWIGIAASGAYWTFSAY
jgi:uncharacterized protein YkwD